MVRVLRQDIEFPNLSGSPSFSGHTHGEGGLNSVTNAGLQNSSLNVDPGDGLNDPSNNNGLVSLGGSVSLDVQSSDIAGTFVSVGGSNNLNVNVSDFLSGDGSGSIKVRLGNGLEGDGNNNIRLRADQVAGNALEEGGSPHVLDIAANGVGSDELDQSVGYTFSSGITFNSGIGLSSSNIIDVNQLNAKAITSNNGNDPIEVSDAGFNFFDGLKNFYGSNNDISIFYDSGASELTIRDEDNGVDLIRQPKSGSTRFIQGIDAGTIEAPLNSLTQIINAPVTSGASAGDTVGIVLSVDNQTAIELSASADGSGGLQGSPQAQFGGDLVGSGGSTIWDDSNTYIPINSLESNTFQVDAGSGLGGGGQGSLGGSLTLSVNTGSFVSISGDSIDVNIAGGLENNGSNSIRVDGAQLAGNVLSEGAGASEVDLNIGGGLENNSGSLRVDPGDLAGDGLTEGGGNVFDINVSDFNGTFLGTDGNGNLTVSIGTGLQNDGSGSIAFDASDTAGNGLTSSGGTGQILDIATNGVGSNELNQSIAYNFTNVQQVSRNDPSDFFQFFNTNTGDSLRFRVTSNNQFQININDSSESTTRYGVLQINPSNGVAQLSNGLDIRASDIEDDGTTIYDGSSSHVPLSILQSNSIDIDAGAGISRNNSGSIQLGNSTTLSVNAGNFLSIAGDSIDVNLGNGLTGDGSGNITFTDPIPQRFAVSGINLPDHGPRLLVGADDDSNQTDIGLEVRGNASGDLVDLSDTDDSPDTKFAVLGSGRTVIGVSNLQSNNEYTDNQYLLDVNGEVRSRDNFLAQGNITADSDIIGNSNTTVFDSGNDWVPTGVLQNNTTGVLVGDGLQRTSGNANIQLGSSATLAVNASDLDGAFLINDGNNNLAVNGGRGLTSDGNLLVVDETTDFTFTSDIDFNNGLTLGSSLNANDNGISSVNNLNVSDITSNNGSDPISLNNAGWRYGDDLKVFWGIDEDIAMRYDSANASFKMEEPGGSGDIFAIDKSGNVDIGGELTEGVNI